VGVEKLGDCILLDQSPIGRTPRMIPASYMKVFDGIRMLFAEQMEARRLGLAAGDFSFNVSGGRCDVCEGEGYTKVEMYFMDDLYVKCESCEGRRFKPKVLGVKVNGKSIYDVLHLNVEEAMDFFHSKFPIYEGLSALHQVGLGYLQVGQPATTLSGGEAQRLKIARELFSRQGRNILYVLDEPTTGLHFEDVRKLVELLNRLVDQGNSVVVVEHHLDVVKCADWVIDLGPGAAHEGGMIVAEGAPEDHVRNPKSVIGPFLKDYLDPSRIIEKTLPNAHIIRDS
jgi:excinuclease ABC subunit A